ncbi:hypothetical protein PJI17_04475 [Mycobacterium kansasii]
MTLDYPAHTGVGLPMSTTRDLAEAVIWGILFRLPCARFAPGRAHDRRPHGRVRPHPWSATDFGRLQGCVRATRPTAGVGGPRQVNSGAVSGAR